MNTLGFFFVPMTAQPDPVKFEQVLWCAVAAFGVGLAAVLALTPLVRWLAHRNGWLDRPDGVRKQHSHPIPRVGGLAVYGAFFAAAASAAFCLPRGGAISAAVTPAMVHLVIASTLVMLVGFLDDVRGVRPVVKIAAQCVGGLHLYLNGYRFERVTNPLGGAPIEFGWLALPITVLWFVAMSNAFNLIDGLDGLAAGVGLFATITLAISAVANGRTRTVVVLCALAGALLGFLRYNFNPASIFLGDSGSLFIGFVLAALSIRSSMKASAVVAIGAPLCALLLPILDVVIQTLRRLAVGHRVFGADHEHIHHRLIRRGFTPRKAVIALYGVAAVGGSLSLVTLSGNLQVIWGAACAAALLAWVGMRQLGYAEFGEFGKLLVRRYLPEPRRVANNAAIITLRADLAKAASVPDVWDALIDTVLRLGFRRVELTGEIAAPPRGAMNPRHAFPLWEAERDDSGVEPPEWSWRVRVRFGEGAVAEIALVRTSLDPLDFDATYLIHAISEALSDALPRVTGSTTSSAASLEPAQTVSVA